MKEDKSYQGNSHRKRRSSPYGLAWPRPSLPLFKTTSTSRTSSLKETRTLSPSISTSSEKSSGKNLSSQMDLEDINSVTRCKLLQPTKYAKCQSSTPNGGWSNPAGFPPGQAPSGYDYWAKALCDETGNGERLCELNICHGFENNNCTPPDCKGCGYTMCGADLKAALLKHLRESDSNTAPQSNVLDKPNVSITPERERKPRSTERLLLSP